MNIFSYFSMGIHLRSVSPYFIYIL